jgi:hypothetical protein
LLRYGGRGIGNRFANRHYLGLGRRTPLNSSDHRSVGCARCGKRHEPVLAPQTINQSTFARAQHLVWQREKISERPYQVCAFYKVRLYISNPDRRVQFKNTIGEFFNPHILPQHKKGSLFVFALKAGHYCTKDGAMGSNLLY